MEKIVFLAQEINLKVRREYLHLKVNKKKNTQKQNEMLFMIKLNLDYKNYFTIFPFLPMEITSDTKEDLHSQK